MNIKEFKKGDEIVRIEPTKISGTFYNPFTQQTEERGGDCSYIGEKLIFVGVANASIYAHQEEDSLMSKIIGKTIIDLRISDFGEGWDYWQDIEDIPTNTQNKIKLNLKQEINKAIKNEDYELIAELKQIFDNEINKMTS